jgi:hypothetical protein
MKQNSQDWFKAFEDYISVVELINKEIETPKHRENLFSENSDKLSIQNEIDLRGPLIYIFKHSIELFLKSGIIFLNNGHIDSSQFHHNIEKLLCDFESDLSESDKFNLEQENLQKLKDIVAKYVKLEIIDDVLSKNKDLQNTAFKYPNKDSFKFWYGLDTETLSERTAEIEEDVRNLRAINYELRGII